MLVRLLVFFCIIYPCFVFSNNVKSYNSWHVTTLEDKCILVAYPRINNKNPQREEYFLSIYFSEFNKDQLVIQFSPGISVYDEFILSLRLNGKVYDLRQYKSSVWSPDVSQNQQIIENMLIANDMTFRVRNSNNKLLLIDRYDLDGFKNALQFLYNCRGD